ncbi:MAG: hypothetical protein GY702_03230 [Desulfobulbaceae bacterium]|nr:hypothetical protein [Desulfobulbaceae bacterium]
MKQPRIYAWRIIWFLAAAVLLSSAPLYALEYKHTAGLTLNYQLSVETPTPQNSQTVNFDLARFTDNVNGSGVMEIHSIISNGTMTLDGITTPLTISGDVMTTMMQPNGLVDSTTATGSLGTIFGQAGVGTASSSPDIMRSLGILEFPPAAVTVGATWSVDKNHTFANGDSLQISYNYTFDSVVSYAGYQCAKILISAQPTFSFFQDFPDLLYGMQVNGELLVSGELLFAETEGRVVKLDETITANQIGITVGYDGMAQVIPSYRQTTISLEIQ